MWDHTVNASSPLRVGAMRAKHHAIRSSFYPTPEQRDFLRRRTMPFLDEFSLGTRTLELILQEVYVQGVRDALEALTPAT